MGDLAGRESGWFDGDSRTDKVPPRTRSLRLKLLLPLPDKQLEARVAMIFAKCTDCLLMPDTPQMPFVDVFRVGAGQFRPILGDELEDDPSIFLPVSLHRHMTDIALNGL